MAPPAEIPRRAVPAFLAEFLGDRIDDTRKLTTVGDQMPPGHRFLMYFHAVADVGRERWQPVKNTKRLALQAASTVGKAANEILGALTERQARLFTGEGWERATELYAPLLTGSGNPHPVENGFAFLSPYGVPYLAGSGIKGVLRRAAEELALLCEDREGWTLPLVWAIFGFDEKSAYITGDESTEWVQGYQQFIESTAQSPDSLLQQLLEIWFEPRGRPKDQPSFLRELRESKQIRGSIHFQGLVSFLDSFPDAQCRLGVDILNPHHKNYYQGSGGESPHDAEQPVPVFFLVMEPGAKFVLRAQLLPGRTPLLSSVGDWKKLLDAAFDYASQWLGFGAKTSVGYGVLGPDREAEAAARRKALEDEERRKKQAEEEAERRAREEEERRRKEAEEAKRARARAEWDALPEHEKIKRRLQEAAEAYLALNEVERRKVRGDLIAAINEALEQGAQLDSAELREDVATCIEAIYEQVGWADPGSNKNARKRQEKNRRKAIEDLRSGNV